MDMYEFFGVISTVCAVLCVLCILLSAAIFFLFRIPEVIGFLSGSIARKSVQRLEHSTAASGNLRRGSVSKSGNIVGGGPKPAAQKKSVLQEPAGKGTAASLPKQRAYVSDGGTKPPLLETGQTDLLNHSEAGSTSVLNASYGATALLTENDPVIMTPQMQKELGMGMTSQLENTAGNVAIGSFQVIKEIVYTHADEVI